MPSVTLDTGATVIVEAPNPTVTTAPPASLVTATTPTGPTVTVSTPAPSVSMQAPVSTVTLVPVVGPAGPSGAASTSYTHTQVTPSTVWDITHALGYRPGGVRVEGSDGDTYWPVVTYLSDDVIRLSLPESINGTAYIS